MRSSEGRRLRSIAAERACAAVGCSRRALSLRAPALILIAAIMLVPLVIGLSYAFRDIQLLNPFSGDFVGLAHFRDAAATTRISGTRCATRCCGPSSRCCCNSSFGLILALLLNRPFPGRALVQALVFLPWAVPTFLSGLNWAWLFNPVVGPLPHWMVRARADVERRTTSSSDPATRALGADHRQCLVGHPLLRDHAPRGAAVDPARHLRGGGDRRRRRASSASARSPCPSWRRPSPSPSCCAPSGSPTPPT